MTTIQTMEYKVSTVLTLQGMDFTSFSDNLQIENDQINIDGAVCEVTMVELSWDKQILEVYINIPIVAESVEQAEVSVNLLLNNASVKTLTILDYEKGEGCIIEIMDEGTFANAEYFEQ